MRTEQHAHDASGCLTMMHIHDYPYNTLLVLVVLEGLVGLVAWRTQAENSSWLLRESHRSRLCAEALPCVRGAARSRRSRCGRSRVVGIGCVTLLGAG